ncbi:hypothetical protein SAMN05216207_10541, partial [Pseudonocardia ammonioxydans]
MTDNDTTAESTADKQAPSTQPTGLDVQLAQELIDKARQSGVSLVGPDGLLAGVTRTVLQAAL